MVCVPEGYAPMLSALGGGFTPRLLVPGSETSVNTVLLHPVMSVLVPSASVLWCNTPLICVPGAAGWLYQGTIPP